MNSLWTSLADIFFFLTFYRDPDNVVLCILATDEEDENDVALQIHFTLIQAFCCDFDINILRVSGMKRLAQVLGEPLTDSNANESKDLHCILVTVSIQTKCPLDYLLILHSTARLHSSNLQHDND